MAAGPESAQSPLTTFLAVWGAVVSTAVALWQIYRGITDRGRLRVHCYVGASGAPGLGIVRENLLVYSVTNVGRRPVVVASVGGQQKRGEYRGFILAQTNVRFPYTLGLGEYFTAVTDDLSMFNQDMKFLTASDTLGREWKAPRRDVRRISAQVAEMRRRGTAGTVR